MSPISLRATMLGRAASRSQFLGELFTCRQCRQNRSFITSTRQRFVKQPFGKSMRYNSTILSTFRPKKTTGTIPKSFFTTAADEAAATKSRFPSVTSKVVSYWLLGSAASVFGIIVFGGLTRLTESGYVVFSSELVESILPVRPSN